MNQWESWSNCCADHENNLNIRFRKRGTNCQEITDVEILNEVSVCEWRPYSQEYDSRFTTDCMVVSNGRFMNHVTGGMNYNNPNIIKLKSAMPKDSDKNGEEDWWANQGGFSFKKDTVISETELSEE